MMMTKSMTVLWGLCILYLMPIQSKKCKDAFNSYWNDEQWLASDCKVKYTCNRDAEIRRVGSHACPANSHCENPNHSGDCICNEGYGAYRTDARQFLLECRKSCKDRVNTYRFGQNWLQNDCKRQYSCNGDGIQTGPSHSCPKNSHCDNSNFYGDCKCNKGFRVTKTDSKGFVQECKPFVECYYDGKVYQIGEEWIRTDCSSRWKCFEDGKRIVASYSCPENSVCDYKKCKCKNGYTATKTAANGFLEECKAECLYGGDYYSVGAKFRQENCKFLYTCHGGYIKGVLSSCPANSSCSNNVCRCKSGYKEIRKDGLLTGCLFLYP